MTILYTGGTKDHFKWEKVPGTALYLKACLLQGDSNFITYTSFLKYFFLQIIV